MKEIDPLTRIEIAQNVVVGEAVDRLADGETLYDIANNPEFQEMWQIVGDEVISSGEELTTLLASMSDTEREFLDIFIGLLLRAEELNTTEGMNHLVLQALIRNARKED